MKRDAKLISSKLYTKDGKIYCKEKVTIEFPKWYEEKNLASIQEVAYIYGIFAIIIGDTYSVSVIPTLCSTSPIMVNEVEKNGTVYTQFIYGKDDCILNDTKVVKHDLLSYNFFETFYMYARIPWFIEYEDMVRIMDNLPGYAKSNVGDNYIANELTSSFIARSGNDKKIFYRQVGKGPCEFTDLMNVYYSALTTVGKIGGNYFTEAIVSAISQKTTTTSKLEDHVRH